MMILAKTIASIFGVGYVKGGGTLAALITCGAWYLAGWHLQHFSLQLVVVVVVFMIGLMTSVHVEKHWGHDSNKVVIDEMLGMMVALFMLPFTWLNVVLAFVLFRLFDIIKPLFIRSVESVRGGWGVMLDDLLAGIYSSVTLHLLLQIIEW